MRAIDYKKVDMTDEEWKYYQELVKQYTGDTRKGSDYFRSLFETDNDGIITIIKPASSIPWAVLFFVQNIMINQRLRSNDQRLDEIERLLQQRT